jgi:hypothetical protein
MNETRMEREVSKRNEITFEQAIIRLDLVILEQQKLINGLTNGLSSLASRMMELERMITGQVVASIGHGPTKRL